MTDRGVSTVVDVALCLLLVSAAVVALTGAPAPGRSPSVNGGSASTAATLLGTTSSTVTVGSGTAERTAHATVAGLLAGAAVANATGEEAFVAAVEDATRRTLRGVPGRVRVTARYRPRPSGAVRGRVSVGRRPPPGADVDAVVFAVPAGGLADRSGVTAGGQTGDVHITVQAWSP